MSVHDAAGAVGGAAWVALLVALTIWGKRRGRKR